MGCCRLSEIHRNYEVIIHLPYHSTFKRCRYLMVGSKICLFDTGFIAKNNWIDKIKDFKPVSDRIIALKINN